MPDTRPDSTSDKQQLYEVLLRYCRAIDRKDFELLRLVFHPDGIDDHGDFSTGGVDALIESCRVGLAQYAITTHSITNTFFEVDGDTAEGETYVLATHITRSNPPDTVMMSARYLDRFERRDGQWGIIYRTYCIDWSNKPDFDPNGPKGAGDANDPSYRVLPKFARVGD